MGKSILIADDEYGIQILLKEILEAQGYTVFFAETGQEVLDVLDVQEMNLLIIDYHLPILNGEQVLQKLKDRGLTIPSILISGMFHRDSNVDDVSSLASSFLAKPFDVLALREKVSSYIT